MVFGACATHFINVFSTVQCALYIATGAQTIFVDKCQIRIFHHDFGQTCAKSLVGRLMSAFVFLNFVRVRAVLDKNAEYIRTIFQLSCAESDCCAAVRCGDAPKCA